MSDEIKGVGNGENIEDDVNIVGINKSKKLFAVMTMLIVAGTAYYFFFFREKEQPADGSDTQKVLEEKDVEKLLKETETPAQETTPKILTPPPRLPDLPPLVMPSVPDIPVITRVVKPPLVIQEEGEKEIPTEQPHAEVLSPPGAAETALPAPYGPFVPNQIPSFLGYDKEKRGAPMIALGGGGESGEGGDDPYGAPAADNRFDSWNVLGVTQSPSVKAAMVGDPRYVILQGHMIDAVLETAINSDIPGVLRAIVSRDVYAEAGNAVMIPKGSRLIGSYFFDSSGKIMRVNVSWSRVILPHGIDVQLNSGGTDELGRNGISGTVDNKVGAVLTSTILLAGVSLSTAFVSSQIPSLKDMSIKTEMKEDEEESGKKSGKTSSTTTLPAKIVSDAVKDFSESIKGIIKKYSDSTPTIYVDQGTVMKVFVNQDIVFPREAVPR